MIDFTLEDIRFDAAGLVPVVCQDAVTQAVLMLAYANREAVERTLQTGDAWYYSRSRQELWEKGATSGHRQRMVRVTLDCDGDTLLYQVVQTGPACHTGAYSCFFRSKELGDSQEEAFTLEGLYRVILQRQREMPEGSYTSKLFAGGRDRILKKIGEEAGEVIIAGKNDQREELEWEISDLVFHCLVLMADAGVTPMDILRTLEKRHRSK